MNPTLALRFSRVLVLSFLLPLSLCGQDAPAAGAGDLTVLPALMPEARTEIFKTPRGEEEGPFSHKTTLGTAGAIVGWGNFEGNQPHAARVHLPAGPMTVTVTLKPSAAVTVAFPPRCDGVADAKVPESKTVRFTREVHGGLWRTECSLPPGIAR